MAKKKTRTKRSLDDLKQGEAGQLGAGPGQSAPFQPNAPIEENLIQTMPTVVDPNAPPVEPGSQTSTMPTVVDPNAPPVAPGSQVEELAGQVDMSDPNLTTEAFESDPRVQAVFDAHKSPKSIIERIDARAFEEQQRKESLKHVIPDQPLAAPEGQPTEEIPVGGVGPVAPPAPMVERLPEEAPGTEPGPMEQDIDRANRREQKATEQERNRQLATERARMRRGLDPLPGNEDARAAVEGGAEGMRGFRQGPEAAQPAQPGQPAQPPTPGGVAAPPEGAGPGGQPPPPDSQAAPQGAAGLTTGATYTFDSPLSTGRESTKVYDLGDGIKMPDGQGMTPESFGEAFEKMNPGKSMGDAIGALAREPGPAGNAARNIMRDMGATGGKLTPDQKRQVEQNLKGRMAGLMRRHAQDQASGIASGTRQLASDRKRAQAEADVLAKEQLKSRKTAFTTAQKEYDKAMDSDFPADRPKITRQDWIANRANEIIGAEAEADAMASGQAQQAGAAIQQQGVAQAAPGAAAAPGVVPTPGGAPGKAPGLAPDQPPTSATVGQGRPSPAAPFTPSSAIPEGTIFTPEGEMRYKVGGLGESVPMMERMDASGELILAPDIQSEEQLKNLPPGTRYFLDGELHMTSGGEAEEEEGFEISAEDATKRIMTRRSREVTAVIEESGREKSTAELNLKNYRNKGSEYSRAIDDLLAGDTNAFEAWADTANAGEANDIRGAAQRSLDAQAKIDKANKMLIPDSIPQEQIRGEVEAMRREWGLQKAVEGNMAFQFAGEESGVRQSHASEAFGGREMTFGRVPGGAQVYQMAGSDGNPITIPTVEKEGVMVPSPETAEQAMAIMDLPEYEKGEPLNYVSNIGTSNVTAENPELKNIEALAKESKNMLTPEIRNQITSMIDRKFGDSITDHNEWKRLEAAIMDKAGIMTESQLTERLPEALESLSKIPGLGGLAGKATQ